MGFLCVVSDKAGNHKNVQLKVDSRLHGDDKTDEV